MRPRQLAAAAATVVAFVAVPAATALAVGVSGSESTPPSVAPSAQSLHGQPAVELVECSTGKQPSSRMAVFRGSMAQVPGAHSMRMNFRLRELVGSSRVWRSVRVPALEVLHSSQPGVAQFAYNQRIDALQRGTTYRVSVNFEWLDANGKPFAHARLRSKVCRQPGKLPNLHPYGESSVVAGPTDNTERYRFQARNTGLGLARGVEVRLTVDGAEVDLKTIGSLRSRASRAASFVGPVCRNTLKVEVDPRDRVREIDEKDNVWRIDCSRYRQ